MGLNIDRRTKPGLESGNRVYSVGHEPRHPGAGSRTGTVELGATRAGSGLSAFLPGIPGGERFVLGKSAGLGVPGVCLPDSVGRHPGCRPAARLSGDPPRNCAGGNQPRALALPFTCRLPDCSGFMRFRCSPAECRVPATWSTVRPMKEESRYRVSGSGCVTARDPSELAGQVIAIAGQEVEWTGRRWRVDGKDLRFMHPGALPFYPASWRFQVPRDHVLIDQEPSTTPTRPGLWRPWRSSAGTRSSAAPGPATIRSGIAACSDAVARPALARRRIDTRHDRPFMTPSGRDQVVIVPEKTSRRSRLPGRCLVC